MPIRNAADDHRTTLTFSGFEANITKIGGVSLKRDKIEKTHMGSTVTKKFMPADLIDPGDTVIECEFDPQALPPIDGPPAALTIVWGNEEGDQWAWADAFITDYTTGGAATGEKMTASITFALNSLPTITPGS